jgi:hypothetical protein
MISEDPSHNSAFYSTQDHEDVDIAAAPAAVAAAAEVVQMDNSGASTGRQLIGEFSIASITTEQMKIDGCNIVGLAGKDARDHYAKGLKNILPVNHRVSLDEDDSGDLYMFMYYDSKKPSNRLPVGCVFFNVGDDCEVITVYWLYTLSTLQHGLYRLGHSIIGKLFAAFPEAVFKLCAKREAAPFWYKMGFRPTDQKIDMQL